MITDKITYQKVKDFIGLKAKIAYQLESAQKDDGSMKASSNAKGDALTTAEMIYLLKTSGIKLKIDLNKAARWLCEIQHPDGKWTTNNPNDWESSTTAWAILALKNARIKCAENIRRAISWLSLKQQSDGGFAQSDFIAEPNTYATAYSGLAFSLLGKAFDSQVSDAFKWLKGAQNTDGGFGLYLGDRSEASLTAYTCHFLVQLHSPEASDVYKKSVGWFLSNQRPSGAWTSWFEEKDSVEGTCFVLFVMCLGDIYKSMPFLKALLFQVEKIQHEEIDNWICISLLHLMSILESKLLIRD